MRRPRRYSNIIPLDQKKRGKVFGAKEIVLLFGGAAVLGSGIGAGMHYWPWNTSELSNGATAAATISFTLCAGSSDTDCVIDGDTIRMNGDKIRLVGFNTPEISKPACAAEAAKGEQAKRRLLELLKSGELSFSATADQDQDRYGRLLRQVTVGGDDVADTLISEGLAEPYQGGQKRNWC